MKLTEKKLERYAQVLWWGLTTARKGKFKRGDIILLRFDLPALPLAEVMQEKLLSLGMNVVTRILMNPSMERNFFRLANSRQLTFQVPGEKELYQALNGGIYLYAPADLRHLKGIDPKKIGKAMLSKKYLRDILNKREEKGLFGWTLCMFPTEALAREASLSLDQYAGQVVKACYLDKREPVKHWRDIYKEATAIKEWLNAMSVKELRVESENMDLRITPGEQRRWVGISGHNIPSFELFISPDWRGTEGTYYANQPSFRSGNYVEGVKLIFKRGRVTRAYAEKGQDFLVKQIRMDKGASRVGEFSLTDKRFSRIDKFMANTLYDENYGGAWGNCHLALGASYSDTYAGDPSRLTSNKKERLGFNDSALHWDLINTEKKSVTAYLKGGKRTIIYENGKFNY